MKRQGRMGFAIILGAMIALTGCGSTSSEGETSNPTDSTLLIPGQAGQQFSAIETSFIPASLQDPTVSSSVSSLTANASTCAIETLASGDFGDCQSWLVRGYVKTMKGYFVSANKLVGETSRSIGGLSVGATGEKTLNDGTKVLFTRTTEAAYQIIHLNSSGQSIFSFESKDGGSGDWEYEGEYDFTKQPGGRQAGQPEQFKIELHYYTGDHWRVEARSVDTECTSGKEQSPSRVAFELEYESGIWKGKATYYYPRFLASERTLTCATAESDSTAGAFATDFVAGANSAKARVYVMPRTVANYTDFDGLTTYALTEVCNHGGWSPIPSCSAASYSTFVNDLCFQAGSHGLTWNSSCSSDTAVGAASYGTPYRWYPPLSLSTYTITPEEELDD